MALVTLQVVDGVDKGRDFVGLTTPVTMGREEGNAIRLNDDRVSRFHAKIQEDKGHLVLTDLDSTNGTRVNGETVQLRLLRAGDRINIGRSTLILGDLDAIIAATKQEQADPSSLTLAGGSGLDRDIERRTQLAASEFESGIAVDPFLRRPPELPDGLSPAQAAQLSEVLDYLHRGLAAATEPVLIPEGKHEAQLPQMSWQRVQYVLAQLARYSRVVGEPPEPEAPEQEEAE